MKNSRCFYCFLISVCVYQSAAIAASPDVARQGEDGAGQNVGDTTVSQTAEAVVAHLPWIVPAIEYPNVQRMTFQSAAAQTVVSYMIYIPPIYATSPERRFPVVYWLHGTGGGEGEVSQAAAYFARAMDNGNIPPMLIVFPNGLTESMWLNSKDGRVPMETIIVSELVPSVDASFRTIASRQGRLVEGFSMGGYGAARFGFKYPHLFGAISMLAGGPLQQELIETPMASREERERVLRDTYGGDQEYFTAQSPWAQAEQSADALRDKILMRQVVGDRDLVLANNRLFHAHILKLGIDHSYVELPATGHDPMEIFQALGSAGWAFYSSVFGAIE